MAELTAAARKKIPKEKFALPEKGGYPTHDAGRARNTLSRVSGEGTHEEKAKVRRAVARDYPGCGPARGGRTNLTPALLVL